MYACMYVCMYIEEFDSYVLCMHIHNCIMFVDFQIKCSYTHACKFMNVYFMYAVVTRNARAC